MRDPQELKDWGKALAIIVVIAAIAYFGWQVFIR